MKRPPKPTDQHERLLRLALANPLHFYVCGESWKRPSRAVHFGSEYGSMTLYETMKRHGWVAPIPAASGRGADYIRHGRGAPSDTRLYVTPLGCGALGIIPTKKQEAEWAEYAIRQRDQELRRAERRAKEARDREAAAVAGVVHEHTPAMLELLRSIAAATPDSMNCAPRQMGTAIQEDVRRFLATMDAKAERARARANAPDGDSE